MQGETFQTIRAVSIALLRGAVLQTSGVSVGNGKLIDWRIVKSGYTLNDGADPFDNAQLFVAMVGVDAALACLDDETPACGPFQSPTPHVVEFMQMPNGGRRRAFCVGDFDVVIEPHSNDDEQAAFAKRLAAIAVHALA